MTQNAGLSAAGTGFSGVSSSGVSGRPAGTRRIPAIAKPEVCHPSGTPGCTSSNGYQRLANTRKINSSFPTVWPSKGPRALGMVGLPAHRLSGVGQFTDRNRTEAHRSLALLALPFYFDPPFACPFSYAPNTSSGLPDGRVHHGRTAARCCDTMVESKALVTRTTCPRPVPLRKSRQTREAACPAYIIRVPIHG